MLQETAQPRAHSGPATRPRPGRGPSHRCVSRGALGLLLLSCGGQPDSALGEVSPTAPPGKVNPTTPPQGCSSDAACPAGYRCQQGLCVEEASCPTAIAPSLRFDGAGQIAHHWALSTPHGHDTLQLTANYFVEPASFLATQEIFLDLVTGQTSTWNHPPGMADLEAYGDQIIGFVGQEHGFTVHVGMAEHDGLWSAAKTVAAPEDHIVLDRSPWSRPDHILWHPDEQQISRWNYDTQTLEPLFPLYGQYPWHIFATPQGEVLVSKDLLDNDPVVGWRYFVTPLVAGATPALLFDVHADFVSMFSLVRAGGEWFVIHDQHATGPDPSPSFEVLRVSEQGQATPVGATHDPVMYAVAAQLLEQAQDTPGTKVRTVTCQGTHCRAMRVDLATLTIEELGSVDVNNPAEVVQARWLACDAVEMLLGTFQLKKDNTWPGTPDKLWHARIAP